MKKIIASVGVLVAMGAIVAGATVAYFNDIETSTNNVFVAGSIDLTVDHTMQTYNSVDCKTCSINIQSDTNNQVIKKDGVSVVEYDAFIAPEPGTWAQIEDVDWIWGEAGMPAGDDRTEYTFKNTFEWWGPIAGVGLDLAISGDDNYAVYLNGDLIGSANNTWSNIYTHTGFGASVNQGHNEITFVVQNTGGYWAGLLYDLTIDGNCDDDYFKTNCTLFGEKDLTSNDHFWMFDDVKPGDLGTNVISLHVDTNDAYACIMVANGVDLENEVLDPEEEFGDDMNSTDGELSRDMDVFVWEDTTNNGVYDPTEATVYVGPIATLLSDTRLELTGGGPTSFIGIAWCAGDLTVETGGAFTCDGHGMVDDVQSDSYTADLVLYAEQVRNNEAFDCDFSLLNAQ